MDESGPVLENITGSVEKVTNLTGELSAASREQAADVKEIGNAVNQMDEATQANAAFVEQSVAAGEALTEQAQTMAGLVRFCAVEASASPAAYRAAEESCASAARASGHPG